MRYSIYLLAILILPIVACKNSKEYSVTRALHDEIMEIHDEVMPKTGDIRKMAKKLKSDRSNITENNESLLKTYDHMITELEGADEMMMKWMERYKKPDFKDTSEETIDALNYQMDRIKSVKERMEKVLIKANNFSDRVAVIKNNSK